MTAIPAEKTTLLQRPVVAHGIADWLTTTDHKQIGLLYIGTSFVFFLIGGLAALALRIELAQPGIQVVGPETYNQLFTMHGTIMMFLFGTPIALGFANYLLPLQIGAPEMAFPRPNKSAPPTPPSHPSTRSPSGCSSLEVWSRSRGRSSSAAPRTPVGRST